MEANVESSSRHQESNGVYHAVGPWIRNNIFDIVAILLQIQGIKLDTIESCLHWIIDGHVLGRNASYCINLLSNEILLLVTTPQSEGDIERALRLLRNCIDIIFAAASDSDTAGAPSSTSVEHPPPVVFDMIAPCAAASQALSRRYRGSAVDGIDGSYAVSVLLQQPWTRRFALYCHLLCDLSPYLSKNHVMQFQVFLFLFKFSLLYEFKLELNLYNTNYSAKSSSLSAHFPATT